MDPDQLRSKASAKPMFSILSTCSESRARSGIISVNNKTMLTPGFITHSPKGSPQNLTPDLLQKLSQLKAVNLCAKDFSADLETLKNYNQGGHKFFNLQDKILNLSYKDCSEFDSVTCVKNSLYVSMPGGKRELSVADYFFLCEILDCDMCTLMSFDVSFYPGNKSIRKCVDKTLTWLDCFLTTICNKSSQRKERFYFAVIQGSQNIFERFRCIRSILERQAHYRSKNIDPIQGYVLGGFGLDEINEDRKHHIDLSLQMLPPEFARMVPGLEQPDQILDAIASGVDVFSNNYPTKIAALGHALVFPLDLLKKSPRKRHMTDDVSFSNELDLNDPIYKTDVFPILNDCPCYTCTNHSKCYIHHLLNTHEMLATILLVSHNLYHYLEWFKYIREAIELDRFEEYHRLFLDLYYIFCN
ncbi:queuine tRNA-ribosyltransferase accessory subunit 2-like [Schistocerca gregaria]|uniref:queuine tRNA-ribosyltransferase accessory subunit 2-like n=1 Tax=Schistocerca gregaria TaxID=7010 RepID=UPI00211DFE97|nr:queuine tRNA-ribosyltransferase accessory subunit 2-like [Schistocerca gregaria]